LNGFPVLAVFLLPFHGHPGEQGDPAAPFQILRVVAMMFGVLHDLGILASFAVFQVLARFRSSSVLSVIIIPPFSSTTEIVRVRSFVLIPFAVTVWISTVIVLPILAFMASDKLSVVIIPFVIRSVLATCPV